MRTEEEIRKEMERCQKERDKLEIGSERWHLLNSRYWRNRCSVTNHDGEMLKVRETVEYKRSPENPEKRLHMPALRGKGKAPTG